MKIAHNKNTTVYVVGAGGHGKVVISALQAAGYVVKALFDDNAHLWGERILDVPVRGPIKELSKLGHFQAVVAIGDNKTRRRIVKMYPKANWLTVIHPAAFVHDSAQIGPGSVVFAGAVIQPSVYIGGHVIVNTSATVDHDCRLSDYVQLCPGVHLSGNVRLMDGAFMGTGAVAVPGVKIGAWSVVGAGAVVIQDLPGKVTAVGVPAHKIP